MPDQVSFRYDAPETAPAAFAEELAGRVRERAPELDTYSQGGTVAALETAFAQVLGKERAVFMPTGTLANHLAVRALARGRGRVLLQERGHLYNDSGDCLQRLSGFNAVPLGPGRASFTLAEVEAALGAADAARVRVDLGALVIETPVRRCHGERFDQGELERICAWARPRGIGLHLDGARIFLAAAATGVPVAAYAAPFDTVYVSLYKYFGAPSGAVLAGPAALLEGIHHERRMFGGGLNQAWPFAAVALAGLDGFLDRFRRALGAVAQLQAGLAGARELRLEAVPNGSNIFRLTLADGRDPAAFRARLGRAGILLPEPEGGTFFLKVNESILARPAAALAEAFAGAARERA